MDGLPAASSLAPAKPLAQAKLAIRLRRFGFVGLFGGIPALDLILKTLSLPVSRGSFKRTHLDLLVLPFLKLQVFCRKVDLYGFQFL